MAKDIILVVGEVINSKADDEDYVGSNFMRVRVTIDITKLLCRGKKIGLVSNTSAYPTYATGVDASPTTTRTALYG